MSLAEMNTADLLGLVSGLLLTLSVFSYVLGDNVLFRIAISVFIGVAAGYAVVMAWTNVLLPQIILPLISGSSFQLIYLVIPLGLSCLLLMKIIGRYSRLGNPAMAYLVGVGIAAAIGGAVSGTIFPQVGAAVNSVVMEASDVSGTGRLWKITEGGIMLIGTISTLAYFHFSVRQKPGGETPKRNETLEIVAHIGQIFIAIAFAALIVGVFSASLMALIERVNFIWQFFSKLF